MLVQSSRGLHETEVLFRKGSPEDPMSKDELMRKFETLASRSAGANARRISDMVRDLEQGSSFEPLSQALSI
jgi:2-methylcitrate dehydratase PrpD